MGGIAVLFILGQLFEGRVQESSKYPLLLCIFVCPWKLILNLHFLDLSWLHGLHHQWSMKDITTHFRKCNWVAYIIVNRIGKRKWWIVYGSWKWYILGSDKLCYAQWNFSKVEYGKIWESRGRAEGFVNLKWGWQAYTTPTVRGICTFAVFFSVSRPFCCFTLVYKGHFILCCKEKLESLDRAMANFKRS